MRICPERDTERARQAKVCNLGMTRSVSLRVQIEALTDPLPRTFKFPCLSMSKFCGLRSRCKIRRE